MTRFQTAVLRIVGDGVQLAAANHRRRNQRIRLTVMLCLQKCDDRNLGEVELRLAHEWLEGGIRHLHVGKIELHQIGAYPAVLQRHRVGIAPHQRKEPDFVGRRQHGGLLLLGGSHHNAKSSSEMSEIGLDLVLETVEALSDEAYISNQICPLESQRTLSRGGSLTMPGSGRKSKSRQKFHASTAAHLGDRRLRISRVTPLRALAGGGRERHLRRQLFHRLAYQYRAFARAQAL